MAGRKEDNIWKYFEKKTDPNKTGCRAVCKSCSKEIQGLVQRLKDHKKFCVNQQTSVLSADSVSDIGDDSMSSSTSSIIKNTPSTKGCRYVFPSVLPFWFFGANLNFH